MCSSEIEKKADFDSIRYAQLWEDADVLTSALGDCADQTLVSICSAGDNALAMLTLDPSRIVVLDLSPAQIACLKLRIAAYQALSHPGFLELTGSRPSNRRGTLLTQAMEGTDAETRKFWKTRLPKVKKYGIGGVGKFERYFRIFRTWLLPLVHSRNTIDAVFTPRSSEARQTFFDTRFNTLRWRLLLNIFFSRYVMGRMGRDSAFFDHVEGSPAQHVARRIHHAAVVTDPSQNPYLHWILKGTHGDALPMAWRPEHFETIRSRLDRLDIRRGSLEAFVSTGEKASGFNLSDIFEYMSPEMFRQVYGTILTATEPNARLVYWNMMAPRRAPQEYSDRIETLTDIETRQKARDMAFFYSDFVVEKVRY